ncbi:MAG TPA: response regulator transcription factor [Bacilli bacterium]|nr:response regulator transcription factor [Bacilli bacterium]HPZ23345.1 response regulator transcription factor [Bacilli bacterium]
MMHILVCDDEELIRDLIKEYAENEGFTCDEASDGAKAVLMCEEHDYDLIIMDIMMPGMDGFTAIKEIKAFKDNIPVIMLSARKEEYDKLQGFDLGIDDYVTKPFSPKELMARVKAVTKRNEISDNIIVGNIELDNVSHEVSIEGEVIEMTNTQFELLALFLSNQGVALSREAIIEKIWGYDYEAEDRTIDAHIKLLRSKLGKYRNSIKTVRKVGYKFTYEEE